MKRNNIVFKWAFLFFDGDASSRRLIPCGSSARTGSRTTALRRVDALPSLARFSCLLFLAYHTAWHSQATDRHWTGSVNGNWNVAANWSDNGVPENGDRLFFGFYGHDDSHRSMTNNLPNLRLSFMEFGIENRDYQLSGNTLSILPVGDYAPHAISV